MNLTSLSARNERARQRIKDAAGALGDALGLPPLAHPTAIEQRQPAVAQMRELECIADLLDAIARALQEQPIHASEERPGSGG